MRHAGNSMNSPKTAVVSGGSSGIGRAFVDELPRRGYQVAPPAVDTPSVAHRNTPKLPPERVVQEALAALAKGKTEVYPGTVRFRPVLLRLAPD